MCFMYTVQAYAVWIQLKSHFPLQRGQHTDTEGVCDRMCGAITGLALCFLLSALSQRVGQAQSLIDRLL